MNAIPGFRYGPHAPAVEHVALAADGANIVIFTAEDRYTFARDAFRTESPLPGLPRRLHAPDGSTIETDASDVIDAWFQRDDCVARAAFALESRWLGTAAIALLAALVVWLLVTYAMPLFAKPVAARISPKAERIIAQRALDTWDRMFPRKSTLERHEQQRVHALVAQLMEGEPEASSYELQFRPMGAPNAFTLPGGIIVVTDELVRFVGDDDELLAVVAHEMGHAHGHHATRLVLQQSGVAVLMTAIAGDAVGMTILAAAVPSVLLNARYGRALEGEADAYAFDLLDRHGVSPQAFANVMKRFAAKYESEVRTDGVLEYMSSHPPSAERIERAEEAARSSRVR